MISNELIDVSIIDVSIIDVSIIDVSIVACNTYLGGLVGRAIVGTPSYPRGLPYVKGGLSEKILRYFFFVQSRSAT